MGDAEKNLGNEKFKAGDYNAAITHFTNAINIEPTHVLYSNRSACYCALRKYDEALKDADCCIGAKPDWGKGYGRKGAALHGMGRFNDAVAAYEAGLKHEPGLAMLTGGMAEAKAEMEAQQDGAMGGLGNVFGQPDVLQRIASNPQTAGFLADPGFVHKIQELAANPSAIGNHLQDQRILAVMGMLMGINIQTADPTPSPAPAKQAKPEPKPEPLTPEQEAAKAIKDEADAHKLKGNTAYKAKQFEEAIKHYEAAIAVLPNEVTYYNNLAAVMMEQKDFDGCIATCKKGIEKGREAKVDYKIIAKSFLRIGNAYKKLGKLDDAIRAYEDSLMEDRSEEAEKLLKQTRALKKKTDEEAYCSPEKAEEARQKGNELFKAGSYAAAVEMYTEAMKRNPKDHVPYSNRAACYQKLMEWQLAIKDADRCVEMDPMFVKGWSRKAGIHFFLKEYHKALDAYDHILKLDPNNEEAKSRTEQVLAAVNSANHSGEIDHERQARAMQDPEILAILGDPQMRSILGEMQSDPKKAKAVMNDPSISAKLQKLIAAGVLQVR